MTASITRRRALLGFAGVSAGVGLAACTRTAPSSGPAPALPAQTRGARPNGTVRRTTLVAQPVELDLGGRVVRTWAYGDGVPGQGLRATAGDRMQIQVSNHLPVSTSVHWHGLAIPNNMDGVPGVTTPHLLPDTSNPYDFVVPDPGTHWFHPHTG
ncbi:MAG: multicopper oxidase domain-containing protein, partial [bacterium]|nr:multicopper oxidase domain-containing protein [bacterium]